MNYTSHVHLIILSIKSKICVYISNRRVCGKYNWVTVTSSTHRADEFHTPMWPAKQALGITSRIRGNWNQSAHDVHCLTFIHQGRTVKKSRESICNVEGFY